MADRSKPIEISQHAQQQMIERGAKEVEVLEVIQSGEEVPAKKNRTGFRKNIQYNDVWAEKEYAVKQVFVIVAEEPDRLVVVTVFTYYF
ncbi:MAG: DUF4258 domain-containing protein [Chloroflexi bacterium]|nr:DUF4258 domain-containing protein [Chloroflexota bacterium]